MTFLGTGEAIGAVRTVQAHAREPYERSRFGDAIATAVDTARRRIRAQVRIPTLRPSRSPTSGLAFAQAPLSGRELRDETHARRRAPRDQDQ